jgi:hypothetical protein
MRRRKRGQRTERALFIDPSQHEQPLHQDRPAVEVRDAGSELLLVVPLGRMQRRFESRGIGGYALPDQGRSDCGTVEEYERVACIEQQRVRSVRESRAEDAGHRDDRGSRGVRLPARTAQSEPMLPMSQIRDSPKGTAN